MLNMYHTRCVKSSASGCVCVKSRTWTEAAEAETLTHNNVTAACLPAAENRARSWNGPQKLWFRFQLISQLRHEFRKCCGASKSRNESHWPRANFLQMLQMSHLHSEDCLSVCPFISHVSMPPCLSSAKSLQEFAAVLQNLEDERTRMVSGPANITGRETVLHLNLGITQYLDGDPLQWIHSDDGEY